MLVRYKQDMHVSSLLSSSFSLHNLPYFCIKLHSHQQCIKVPTGPQACCCLVLAVAFICTIMAYILMVTLICIFFMANEVEHLLHVYYNENFLIFKEPVQYLAHLREELSVFSFQFLRVL